MRSERLHPQISVKVKVINGPQSGDLNTPGWLGKFIMGQNFETLTHDCGTRTHQPGRFVVPMSITLCGSYNCRKSTMVRVLSSHWGGVC